MERAVVTCSLALLALLVVPSCHGLMYNPCSGIGAAARGDAFVVGLALIPGGNATELELELDPSINILGMCNQTYQEYLINTFNARIAVFNLKLDRLQVLRLPYPDIVFSIANSTVPTMTVIVFRNNLASVPVYLANGGNYPSLGGAGFVVSLALLLDFDKGLLSNLYWYDLTCNSCGGRSSQICIKQVNVDSCATPFTNCTCAAYGDNCTYADAQFSKCSTAINVGFSGTDSRDAAFRTGSQIKRLNAYSLTGLFYTAKDLLVTNFNNIYGNVTGSWNQLQSDSKNQQLDFGSSIGGGGGGSSGGLGGTPPPLAPPRPPPEPPIPPPPPPNPLPPGFGG